MIIVQFPNSVPVIVNLDLTLNFVTLMGRPQCNGRFCWQASLFHLPPKFTRTVKKCGNGNGVRELYYYQRAYFHFWFLIWYIWGQYTSQSLDSLKMICFRLQAKKKESIVFKFFPSISCLFAVPKSVTSGLHPVFKFNTLSNFYVIAKVWEHLKSSFSGRFFSWNGTNFFSRH